MAEITPTSRELIVQLLNSDSGLRDMGLAEGSVYQADTVTAPDPNNKPFIVVRWLRELPGMGAATRRPFDLWFYDERGDYDRSVRMANHAKNLLNALEQIKIVDGWYMKTESSVRGEDLFDPAFDAVVVTQHCVAVASGL